MQDFDVLRRRYSQRAQESELTILAKAQEMREAVLLGEAADVPGMLRIADFLESSVHEVGCNAGGMA